MNYTIIKFIDKIIFGNSVNVGNCERSSVNPNLYKTEMYFESRVYYYF